MSARMVRPLDPTNGASGWASHAPDIGFDPILSRLHVTRRLGATISLIGIGSAQLAAHLGVYDVPDLRRYELFGIVSLIWLMVFWGLPWSHGQRNLPGIMSISCLGLVGGTVALTGAGDSLAWIYAMPLAFFNALYFRPRVAFAILPGIMATGMIPAAATQQWAALNDHIFIVAPVYVIVTVIGIALVPELRGTAEARLQSLLAEQRAADTERWMKRLEAVQDAAWEAHQFSSVQQICEGLIGQARRAADYDACLIHLVSEDRLETIIQEDQATDASGLHRAPRRHLFIGEDIPGWVAREGQPLVLPNVADDARSRRTRHFPPVTESVISVPLTGHDRVIGVMTLYKLGHGQFSQDDLKAMMILGDHAGMAISNAQLLATTRHLAETDGLTGLLNQSAGRLRLRTLLGERQADRPLSILLLDLDGFKPINDALGHLAGDKYLCRVADILRAASRNGDVLSRSGGDEFMVVLPDATRSEAEAVGAKISRMALSEGADLGIVALTPIFLSVGVATAPDDGETATRLLEVADVRLYADKQQPDVLDTWVEDKLPLVHDTAPAVAEQAG
jgi:diguanylate cyclase (GGDEF)-like protein